MLMAPFSVAGENAILCDVPHNCCDICEKTCKCTSCVINKVNDEHLPKPVPVASNSRPVQSRTSLSVATLSLSIIELLSAITDKMIQTVLDKHITVYTINDIQLICPSLSHVDAAAILDMIDSCYE